MKILDNIIKRVRKYMDEQRNSRQFHRLTGLFPNEKQKKFFSGKALAYIFERREGRTTALIAQAMREAFTGKNIVIIVTNEQQAEFTRKEILKIIKKSKECKKVQYQNSTKIFFFPSKIGTIQVWPESLRKSRGIKIDSYLYDLIE